MDLKFEIGRLNVELALERSQKEFFKWLIVVIVITIGLAVAA